MARQPDHHGGDSARSTHSSISWGRTADGHGLSRRPGQ